MPSKVIVKFEIEKKEDGTTYLEGYIQGAGKEKEIFRSTISTHEGNEHEMLYNYHKRMITDLITKHKN